MDVQDIIFNRDVDFDVKLSLLTLMQHYGSIHAYTKVLTPTASNDDVNGSQHASNGGNDFTYRDVDISDVTTASSLGFYEYFSNYGSVYTGHYYNGDMSHFDAVVIDPPAYAQYISV